MSCGRRKASKALFSSPWYFPYFQYFAVPLVSEGA